MRTFQSWLLGACLISGSMSLYGADRRQVMATLKRATSYANVQEVEHLLAEYRSSLEEGDIAELRDLAEGAEEFAAEFDGALSSPNHLDHARAVVELLSTAH